MKPAPLSIAGPQQLQKWIALNDTVMGGSSQASCSITPEGLLLKGELVERAGGFVSCRSPRFTPPLNLSAYSALKLEIEGEGRTLKLALACYDSALGLTELIPGGLRWVAPLPTQASGISVITIPFRNLCPTIQARPLKLPLRFNPGKVTRLQILYSKFSAEGGANPSFCPGPVRILLRSVHAVD